MFLHREPALAEVEHGTGAAAADHLAAEVTGAELDHGRHLVLRCGSNFV